MDEFTNNLIVLHIIPTLEGGGAERQLSILACEQSRRGMKVHVASRRFGVHEYVLKANGVMLHSLGDWKSLNPMLFFNISRLMAQLKPSVVQTWLTQMDLVGGAAALMLGFSWIGTERSNRLYYQNLRNAFEASLRTQLFKWASAIVANSNQAAAEWRKKLPDRVGVFSVSNAVDSDEIQRHILRESSSTGDERPIILIVGRLIQSKGLDVVLDAFRILALAHKFRGIIIGDGPLRKNMMQLIEKFDLDDQVSLMPYNDEWWSYMSNASMLISMSRVEGRPNVILEAMVGECPLIVSDIPSHREVLDSQSALIVPVDDVNALVTSIQSIIKFPEESCARAINAKRRSELFTVSNMVNSYSTVYQLTTMRNRK